MTETLVFLNFSSLMNTLFVFELFLALVYWENEQGLVSYLASQSMYNFSYFDIHYISRPSDLSIYYVVEPVKYIWMYSPWVFISFRSILIAICLNHSRFAWTLLISCQFYKITFCKWCLFEWGNIITN